MPVCVTCQAPKDDGDFRVYQQSLRKQCKACDGQDCVRWQRGHPERTMLTSAKSRAKRQNVPFSITAQDIKIPDTCPVFGHKLENGTRASHDWAPSLDRKKPELGYVPGNVQVLSTKANRLKSDASIEELKQLVAYREETEL